MRKFFNIILTAAILIAAIVLQCSVLPWIQIGGITPNLMLITSAAFGLILGDMYGLLTGLACGLLYDILFGTMFGFTGAVLALCGYLCGQFKRVLYVEGIRFPLILIALFDLMYGFLNYVFLFMFRNRLFFGTYMAQIVLPEIVYTIVLAVPVYPLMHLILTKLLPEHTDDTADLLKASHQDGRQ